MVNVVKERIRTGRPRQIAGTDGKTLYCLHAEEPNAVLGVAQGSPALWLSLAATLRMELPEGYFGLEPRHFHYSNGESPVSALSRSAGSWMAIILPPGAECSSAATTPRGEVKPAPFPLLAQPLNTRVLRCVAALWRLAGPAPASIWCVEHLIGGLIDAVAASQAQLESLLDRCPGKTLNQKRQVLNRLVRVRNHVELNESKPLSVQQMADLAHYSSCHFVRVFETVFGETPHQFVLASRMRKAEALLRRPNLAIVEIANQLGFSSGAAFARTFKSYFNQSASALRAEHARAMTTAANPNRRRQLESCAIA